MLVVLVLGVVQELRVELEDGVEVETADIEDLADRRVSEMDLLDRRARIHFDEALPQRLLLVLRDEVGLRQQDAVRRSPTCSCASRNSSRVFDACFASTMVMTLSRR
mgnify:CR=1 FL=1